MGAFGAGSLLGFLVALLVAGVILSFSARLVGIERASLGRAIVAIVGGGILGAIVSGLFLLLPGPLSVLALLAFVLTYIWVIKVVFETDWVKATMAWLMAMVVELIVTGIFVLLGVVTLAL